MRKPRLIYDNDARHHLLYRYGPPLTDYLLRQPVDEILGTSVDTLFYGFISKQASPYKSSAGLYWDWSVGEREQVMWWRAGENLKQVLNNGQDPLKIVIDKAHDNGIQVLTWLYWEPPLDLNSQWKYSDHADLEVVKNRLETVEEALEKYGFDGIGLNYYVPETVFSAEVGSPSLAPNNASALTDFVIKVRSLLDSIGKNSQKDLALVAKVHPDIDQNIKVGLEIDKWLEQGLIDMVIPSEPHPNDTTQSSLLDTNPMLDNLVNKAKKNGAWIYGNVPGALYDDREYSTTIEMYRAAATNHLVSGVDGIYLSSLSWPHGPSEYQILRELGYPELYSRKPKHYFLGHSPAEITEDSPIKQLPVNLEEGVAAEINLFVGDDLEKAKLDIDVENIKLIVRILQVCPEDKLSFSFNGNPLDTKEPISKTIYGGSVSYMAKRGGLPSRITTYDLFELDIDVNHVIQGYNSVKVLLDYHHKDMTAQRVLNSVEFKINYEEPHKPIGGQM